MEKKQEEWKRHIAEQNRSGLSKAEYARQHGFSDKKFFYWQRRLGTKKKPHFIELGALPSERLEIRICDSVTLCVPQGFNAEELKRVIEALC